MHSYIWKGLIGVAFTGGLLALGAGVAYADSTTSGDDGTGSGSQAVVGLNLPISIGGSSVSVLGDSSSSGSTTTPPAAPAAPSGSTSGDVSLLGGSQALLDVHAPVAVGGNAISVIGDSGASSSTVGSGSAAGASGSGAGSTGAGSTGSGSTSADDSTLGGTQVLGDVSAPVTVSGNAISVAGDSTSGGSFAGQSADGSGSTAPAAGPSTTGDNSTLGGTQVVPDVTAPVTATGDAISVVGDSTSGGGTSGSTSGTGTGGGTGGGTGATPPLTTGDGSILGGSQIAPTVTAPITIGGDAVSVIGDSTTTPSDPGQPGTVGGVDTFPPTTNPGTISAAALSSQALAETGVNALPGLIAGLLLLLAGLGVAVRGVIGRKMARS
ncbi:MAG TPA: hypothetical protein VGM70_04700 [Pseudolysinimonas sp.]|jgi:hypothetical protein